MNLIEQLGGYEKAKYALVLECKLPSPNTRYIIELQDCLLQYRRENNIFEVGDWVVVGDFRVLAQFVGYVHKDTHAELPQIKIDGQLFSSFFDAWEHATDAEIKANKRLEVL